MGCSRVIRAAFAVWGLAACASSPQGMMMNQFIPDEKLARVRVCVTTGRELVESFGPASGQGRDGDMGTLTWNAAAVVHGSEASAVGTQSVHAWVDSAGLVAAFVVNPTSIPQKPAPCSEQAPVDAPDPAPAPPEKPKQARPDATPALG
ncbi:MAG TPA: hypothetical protein VFZ53_25085 [Polyangiaceae bacterium]